MWASLLTVAGLSLLIFSAMAAIATYLYFFGSGDTAQRGFPSIAPDVRAGRLDQLRAGSAIALLNDVKFDLRGTPSNNS